jgi:hypothetical protein
MKTVAAIVVLILVRSEIGYGQAFPYRPKSDIADISTPGEVSIALAATTLRQGDTYSVRYTFHAMNRYYVYNWQFISLIPLPGQLAVYDENKKYIGDLIAYVNGSRTLISKENWTYLYGGAFVGTSLRFTAGRVNSPQKRLPPGTYYIQLVLYRGFLSHPPSSTPEGWPELEKRLDRSELCRSNAIKIEILEK